MKKISIIIVLLLCTATIFSGCMAITNILDPLPDNYVDGVDLSKEYSEEFEIYDDAIIFELEDDEEEIVLTYGITDEIDDIIDYYDELFEDLELRIDEMEDEDDEFYASGIGEEYKFQISAEPAKGEYEERAFLSVVEVSIYHYTMGEKILEKMQGFWLGCGRDGIISDVSRVSGFGMNFESMTVDIYDNFVEASTDRVFKFVEENIIEIENPEADNTLIEVKFETIDGIEIMTLSDDGDIINFEKSSYDEMTKYQVDYTFPMDLSVDLSDEDLEYLISNCTWTCKYYMWSDGYYEEFDWYNIKQFDSETNKGTDEFDDGLYEMDWFVKLGHLFITYEGYEKIYNMPIDFEHNGAMAYLYVYDLEEGYEGCAWVYEWGPVE